MHSRHFRTLELSRGNRRLAACDTALAAINMDYPPEKLHVYVLDDGTRAEFRDFNAEGTANALFLAELGAVTDDHRYIDGAEKGMSFIEREVVPRQRWFDFETFLSCARKDYGFFDSWTAQYPQNNLAAVAKVNRIDGVLANLDRVN